MRKPVLLKVGWEKVEWPTQQIAEAIDNLFGYLEDYLPEQSGYSKTAIMGPVGKLLSMIEASQFGESVESYVGHIINIHNQSSKKLVTQAGIERLRKGVEILVDLKKRFTDRDFHRIVRSVDYGVYFRKSKEIAEKREEKKEQSKKQEGGGQNE
ncbi:hypothetical protein B9Q09_02055 [Candidatus Marsarchaeota G2 archaeon ECH_B_SAG-C16]|jgi:hypothetical protein|uniref:Uncharacterized protein n=2 Tax=Candidatus Marsarchaeota group 2 TaxID=2203771 RepID=A0A2R6CDS8_9ARCH|nr:MAG: hypothetical protein B9Q09_02055 [Candidatus Marsarchaeota G2 archaeon ECH_B_SAG-C16]PSO09052.1 MAG: hypothetical protein B9Q04_02410 [Candidatus Marsarchaeota G2 archaeon BE_D]